MKTLLALFMLTSTSFFSLQFTGSEGNAIAMNSYAGKKVLVVNIATGSNRVSQLGELQQLHQQYGDSVVIIAFPSNSFGHESRTDAEIRQFCQSQYNVGFLLASKQPVTGASRSPVYQWLAHTSENGIMDTAPAADFQKYLINGQGRIVGVFAPSVSPMDSTIIKAIQSSY